MPGNDQYDRLDLLCFRAGGRRLQPACLHAGSRCLEAGVSCCTTHRAGVVAVGVERGVQVGEVKRGGVEAAQNLQVVPGPDRPVGEVGYGGMLCCQSSDGRFH